MNITNTPMSERPTTRMPDTAPPRSEMRSASATLCCAAAAVRRFDLTATNMPTMREANKLDLDKRPARPPRGGGLQPSGASLENRARGGNPPYRSMHAPTESIEERAEGRRLGEGQEQGPRLADHGRARHEDRLARARAARRDAREGPAGREADGLWLSHRGHRRGLDQDRPWGTAPEAERRPTRLAVLAQPRGQDL